MVNDDITFMPPGDQAVIGREAIGPWLRDFPRIKELDWSIDFIEQSGDVAWLRGPNRLTLEVDGDEQTTEGKFCDIVRRGSDGKWRFSLIIWNENSD